METPSCIQSNFSSIRLCRSVMDKDFFVIRLPCTLQWIRVLCALFLSDTRIARTTFLGCCA